MDTRKVRITSTGDVSELGIKAPVGLSTLTKKQITNILIEGHTVVDQKGFPITFQNVADDDKVVIAEPKKESQVAKIPSVANTETVSNYQQYSSKKNKIANLAKETKNK